MFSHIRTQTADGVILMCRSNPRGLRLRPLRINIVYFAEYELKEGSLFIEYSSGPCKPERKGGWNVPKDIVIMVNFTPKKTMRIADLKLDRKKFRNIVDDHVTGALYYVNDEEGITYAVQNGEISFVEYHATKKR